MYRSVLPALLQIGGVYYCILKAMMDHSTCILMRHDIVIPYSGAYTFETTPHLQYLWQSRYGNGDRYQRCRNIRIWIVHRWSLRSGSRNVVLA